MAAGAQSGPLAAQAGIGLRFPHHGAAREQRVAPWLEVHPENYLDDADALADLLVIRERHELSLHAVGLSLGSDAGPDAQQLARIAALAERLQPALLSDHLSFSTGDGLFVPDLLPLPYTPEALAVVARNVTRVQETLGRRILVENPSSYLEIAGAVMPESQFLGELVRRTGCGVLLDVNNVHVSAHNRGASPLALLRDLQCALPRGAVEELHLAGHAQHVAADGTYWLIDDHGSEVTPAVWSLYRQALRWCGALPTLIEWDTRVPPLAVLQEQAAHAQHHLDAQAPVHVRAG